MAKKNKSTKKQQAAKNKAKQQKKASSSPNFLATLRQKAQNSWLTRSPVFLFVGLFAILMGIFYMFWISPFFQRNVVENIANFDAALASFFLNLLGQGTTAQQDIVSSSDFSISIKRGCDGLEAIALYVAAIAAYPINFNYKIKGILSGVGFLFVINLLRIITLFLIGLYIPSIFDIMHVEVWQALFLILAVVCWLYWIQWAIQKQATTENSEPTINDPNSAPK